MTAAAVVLVLMGTGVGVGLAQGFLGLGGGFIMVPMLVFLFERQEVPTEVAVPLAFGTSLAVVFATAISGAHAHHRKGHVWWRAAVVLGVGGAVGSLLGSTLTTRVIDPETLKSVFGGVTILAGLFMLVRRKRTEEDRKEDRPLVWVAVGFPAGVVVGLMAIGGGIVLVPIMTILLGFGLHRAVGTSTGTMLFTTSVGALSYLLQGWEVEGLPSFSFGYVNGLALLCIAGTSMVTAQIAASFGHRLPEAALRVVFVGLMFYLGVRMLGV